MYSAFLVKNIPEIGDFYEISNFFDDLILNKNQSL